MSADPEPAPPPTTAYEALAAAAGPLFNGRPRLDPPTFDRVSGRTFEPFNARALAAALVPLFARRFVVHVEGEYDERRLVARLATDGNSAVHCPRDEFAELVAGALQNFPAAPASAPYAVRRAAEHTRLASGSSSPYVRRVAAAIVDGLPFLRDLDPQPEFVRSGVVPSTISPEERAERRRAYMREHSRAARAAVNNKRRDDALLAAAWCLAWREQVAPGTHAAPEVHAVYLAAAEQAGREPIGRTMFFRVAEQALGPRKRRAAGPVFVVPADVPALTREERRAVAARVVDDVAQGVNVPA